MRAIRIFGLGITLFAATIWAAEHEDQAEDGEHGEHAEQVEHGDHAERGDDLWHHGAKIEAHKIGDMPNASAFGKYVYFGGQPTAEDLKLLAGNGVKVVINLRTQAEIDAMDFDEKSVVESHGMTYLNVPVGRDPIDEESLGKIAEALEKAGDAPILMHCKSSNRVGYVWSLYRARHHGLGTKAAMTEGRSAGMKSEALAAKALEQLEPAHHQ